MVLNLREKSKPQNFELSCTTQENARDFVFKNTVGISKGNLKFTIIQVQKQRQPKTSLKKEASVVNMPITVQNLGLKLQNMLLIMVTNRLLLIFVKISILKFLNLQFVVYVINYYTTRDLIL